MNLADGWNFPFAIGEIIIWKQEPTIGNSFALPSPFDLYWKGDSQTWVIQILKVKRQLVIRSG
jgi:hypothetical protein